VGRGALDEAGLLEGGEGAVFVDGLEGLAGGFDDHVATEFRDEDALFVEVWRDFAIHGLGDVTTDTAFFLGETGTVDSAAAADAGTSDAANSGHCFVGRVGGGEKSRHPGFGQGFSLGGERVLIRKSVVFPGFGGQLGARPGEDGLDDGSDEGVPFGPATGTVRPWGGRRFARMGEGRRWDEGWNRRRLAEAPLRGWGSWRLVCGGVWS